jgi:hypothetical protein
MERILTFNEGKIPIWIMGKWTTVNRNMQLYSGSYRIIMAKIRSLYKKLNEFINEWINFSKMKTEV